MRFNNIQFLRLLAATAVVATHLSAYASSIYGLKIELSLGPFTGFPVPLFFAVSGFILAHVLRTCPLRQYFAARFLRLYPGYWLALAIVIALMRLRRFTEYHRWLIKLVNVTEITLWPAGPDHCPYLLGIEWSLIYEVFLSIALGVLSRFGQYRGVPLGVGTWLAAIAAKIAIYPGYAFNAIPHWSTIALSAYSVPFLLGVLAHSLRESGRRLRWAVLPAVIAFILAGPQRITDPELHWCAWGLAAAGTVWLAVNLPPLPARSLLVRAGDWTYGLYLIHVNLLLAVFYAATRHGWAGRLEVVWAAGILALLGGLLFGRCESALHARLRHWAKANPADIAHRLLRIRPRTILMHISWQNIGLRMPRTK